MTSTKRENRGARVVLISLYNRQYAFGLRYLSAVLRERGHHVDLIFFKQMTRAPDSTFNLEVRLGAGAELYALPSSERDMGELVGLLGELNPDLVGISLISSFFSLASDITARVKSAIGMPVIWGGPHPTLVPEECLRVADIVCIGEGEGAMVELAARLCREENIADIENLWVKRGDGSIARNPLRPLVSDLDGLPFPDYSDEEKHYILDGVCSSEAPEEEERAAKTYYIMSSRGCPFSCSFCCNSCFKKIFKDKGPSVRRRSVGNVIGEVLEAMERRETNFVHFWDDVFTLNKEWIREFRDEWNRWVGLPFMCYAHPVYTDREIFRMLKDCGLNIVNIGIQSGSERTNRECFNRRQKKEQIVEAAKFLRELGGVEVKYDVILDNPFEDDSDHRETLDLLLSLPRPFSMFTFSLCYFPKAEITERALDSGFISERDVEGSSGKAVEQYIVSFERTRPKLNQFWNTLIGMARYRFFPGWLIRWLSNQEFFRDNPRLLSFLAVRVVKLAALNYRLLNRLLGRPGPRMQRIVERPTVDVVPFKREAADLIPTVRIRNRGPVAKEVLLCLDIYPMERPRHPRRHVGFWGKRVELPPGDTELDVALSLPRVEFKIGGIEAGPDLEWMGRLREEGWYDMTLALMEPEKERLRKRHRLLSKRVTRCHSSKLFANGK